MKLKKILFSILIAAILSLAACSSSEPEFSETATATVTETTAESTTVVTTTQTSAETTTTAETTEATTETATETATETTTVTTTETTTETTPPETTTETTEATTTTVATTTQNWWTTAYTTTGETEPRPDHPYLGERDEAKPYYLKVNTLCNTVTVYSKDKDGYHTVPKKVMVCSTGDDTPQNVIYSLQGKGKWQWLYLFGDVYGRYATQINGNILFHSVPYLRYGDKGSLKYAEYDKLGTSCSMGCIRLVLEDAIWVYMNSTNIAGVEFYSDPNPGPLGKPSAAKISDNEVCRGWDPTDTDPENPWLSWVEPTETTVPTTEATEAPSSEVTSTAATTATSKANTSQTTVPASSVTSQSTSTSETLAYPPETSVSTAPKETTDPPSETVTQPTETTVTPTAATTTETSASETEKSDASENSVTE